MKRGLGIQITGAKLLPGERDLALHGLNIDVVERDVASDPDTGARRWDINIIVRVLPGFEWPDAKVKTALKETFGTPDHLELLEQRQSEIRKQIGVPLDQFDNLFIAVKWPRSKMYSADAVKEHFVKRLARLY